MTPAISPDMTPVEQQQCLQRLWPTWRAIATSTGRTEKTQAEAAIQRLYRFYQLKPPEIVWWHNLIRLPRGTSAPLFTHARDSLIYSVWHHLTDPQWVCEQIGYTRRDSVWRLPINNRLVLSRSRTGVRSGRPAWLLNANNVISQFDVDVLALQTLATELGIAVDPTIAELAAIIKDIITTCFGVVLFEDFCWAILKPRIAGLNDGLQLAAQNKPAFETAVSKDDHFTLYAMNGRILSVREPPRTHRWDHFAFTSPPTRAALIDYLGWEEFFALAQRNRQTQHLISDAYGVLYRILCGTQQYLVVRVKNSTREPDGTWKHYIIPVDSRCRPAPNPLNPVGEFGAPQVPTPLNAIGSSFGMTGEEYAAILGQET